MEEEWNRLQWRDKMLKRASNKKDGFLRHVKPWNGSQIQAKKWVNERRELEDPDSSVLGWRFSVVSKPIPSSPTLMKCRSGTKTVSRKK